MATLRAIAVKERPILFSAPMVRAILEGRKTQTRRVVKPQPMTDVADTLDGKEVCWPFWWAGATCSNRRVLDALLLANCLYGVPSDRLWVRETWIPVRHGSYEPLDRHEKPRSMYEATTCYAADPVNGFQQCWDSYEGKWRPSIFMPRWASRITLEVVEVRVERVQDISEEDARAEGVERPKNHAFSTDGSDGPVTCVDAYAELWDSINLKRGYGWDKNPWVWVIEFKQITGA